MQCLLVLLCWFDLFPATMDMDNRRYKLQMSVIYPLLVFRHVRNSYKGNVICFSVLILWKRKCCHVQSPDVLCPLKLHEKQSVVVLKVSSCFFCFFCLLFCMHFHVIDSPLPLLRVSSARPHLSLYSVTYSIQGESSYHLSEIFQTGLSLLICDCGAGNPHNCDVPSLFCLSQSFLGQTFCTLGEIIGSTGSRLERVLS